MAHVTPRGHGLGWHPSRPDFRDLKYADYRKKALPLPASVDLRKGMLPVRDQRQMGSCTGFASTAAAFFTYVKDGWHHPFAPSPLFQYQNELILEGNPGQDYGATIRDAVKALATYGMTAETNWPYDETKLPIQAPQAVYDNAHKHLAQVYMSVAQDINEIKACLAEGYPLIIGISVYESFESDAVAATGIVPMPQATEQALGGHAICLCGYDDTEQLVQFQNSWGPSWGQAGYGELPYAYVTDSGLAGDFWTLRVQK